MGLEGNLERLAPSDSPDLQVGKTNRNNDSLWQRLDELQQTVESQQALIEELQIKTRSI